MNSIWDIYAAWMHQSGIERIFGMVGDGFGLLEAAMLQKNIKVVTVQDQRVGVAIAAGYAQVTKHPAVYVASPGPALANASMAILEAFSLQIPLVIISNGVSRKLKGTGAFQEFDAIGFMSKMTKWSYRVESEDRLSWALERAFHLALNGKKGPVFLEIPDDLVNSTVVFPQTSLVKERLKSTIDNAVLKKVLSELLSARNIVMIGGGGCISAEIEGEFGLCVEKLQAAAFLTASGRGAISENHSQFAGVLGLYLTPPAHDLLKEADAVLIIGSQLEETALLGVKEHLQNKVIVQIDQDPEIIGKSVPVTYGMVGDAKLALKALIEQLDSLHLRRDSSLWISKIKQVRQKQQDDFASDLSFSTSPVRSMFHALQKARYNYVVLENGMHDMWGYFSPVYQVIQPGRTFAPGEQTGLGLSVGIAVGVKMAAPKTSVALVIGDGGFQFGQLALRTAAEQKIGLTIFVINNGGFGWPALAQSQQHVSIGARFAFPQNVEQFAKEMGAVFFQPHSEADIEEALKACHLEALVIIEIKVPTFQDIPVGIINNYFSPAATGHS